MMKILVLILVLALSGCSLFEDKLNNAVAFTSDQIVTLALQVERAQSLGKISEPQGDKYLTWLIYVNELLRGSSETFNEIEICDTSQTKFQCIDAVMATIEEAL